MKFIRLTGCTDDNFNEGITYINIDSIMVFRWNFKYNHTRLILKDMNKGVAVKEKPEEIIETINRCLTGDEE